MSKSTEWRRTTLGECTAVTSGATPKTGVDEFWDGDICWITPKDISDLEGKYLCDSSRKITNAGLASCAATVLPVGSVLFSSRAPIGLVAIAKTPTATNQGCKSFIPDPRFIDSEFLFYWLKAHRSHIESLGVGATFKEVNKKTVESIEIALPPLPEQKRIAAILDSADAIRQKRKAAIAKLDVLAQSVFLEMFGDPVSNPMHWDRVAFADLLENIESGTSPVCLDRPAKGKEWGVLKLGAVTKCKYLEGENKALPDGFSPDESIEVKNGDLLFSRKNTYELVGACALVKKTRPHLLLPDLIFRFRLRDTNRIAPIYLHQLLVNEKKRKEIQKLANGSSGSMPNISKSRLLSALVEIPPIDLQRRYSLRINAIEELLFRQSEALAKESMLFEALQHRAFAGEL